MLFFKSDNEIDLEYENRYLSFITLIVRDRPYARDFELASAALLLKRKIYIYRIYYIWFWIFECI